MYSPKFDLKSDNDLQFTKSAGSEFHSVIDLGKKEMLTVETAVKSVPGL